MSKRSMAVFLAMAVVATACGQGGGDVDTDDRRPSGYFAAGEELTEAEFRYGQTPEPHDDVTYQPDVVMIEGGAEAVRSVTADGMTWTLDAGAPGASDLVPGKVMFVTSRGVGRIVDAEHSGDAVAVTIAPVELTEVIRDGTFSSDEPIVFDNPIAYSAEGAMWNDESTPSSEATLSAPTSVPTDALAARLGGGQRGMSAGVPEKRLEQPKPVVGAPQPTKTGGFTAYPFCCHGGVGAHLTYDDTGIRVAATATLVLDRPLARFHLSISGGRIRVAELEVHGAGGIKIDIEAASAVGTDRQLNKTFPIPIDFSVPVGHVLGLPFTLSARQEVLIKTAFSARNGNIKASGAYTIGGTIAFGYRNGAWGTRMPDDPSLKRSLLDSIHGVSMGVNGIVVASKTTFSLGIGAFGFTTGLNAGLTVSTGITVGGATDRFAPLWAVDGTSIDCRGASLSVDATYYVGYTLPAIVVSVINFFMKPFGVKPVPRTGGIPSPPGREHLYDKAQYEPHGCR